MRWLSEPGTDSYRVASYYWATTWHRKAARRLAATLFATATHNGPNVLLNIKATAATVLQFGELADELNVPLGPVLEPELVALTANGSSSSAS